MLSSGCCTRRQRLRSVPFSETYTTSGPPAQSQSVFFSTSFYILAKGFVPTRYQWLHHFIRTKSHVLPNYIARSAGNYNDRELNPLDSARLRGDGGKDHFHNCLPLKDRFHNCTPLFGSSRRARGCVSFLHCFGRERGEEKREKNREGVPCLFLFAAKRRFSRGPFYSDSLGRLIH